MRPANGRLRHAVVAFIWPRAGWKRAVLYYRWRLKRLGTSPESIAAGFACGAAISIFPLVGFHFLCSALLAFLLRANVIASAFGTVVGNPWTFPVIWAGTYRLGKLLLGSSFEEKTDEFAVIQTASQFIHGITSRDAAELWSNAWALWWPMTIGAAPIALIVWIVSYKVILNAMFVRRHRRSRKVR